MVEKGLLQSLQIKENPLTQNFIIGKRGRPKNNQNKDTALNKIQKTEDDNDDVNS